MRINRFESFVVGNPTPELGGPYWIFVKLETACGIAGYGEIYGVPFSPSVVEKMAADVFARRFLNEDPRRVEFLCRRARADNYAPRPDASLVATLSALEIACLDIAGKACGLPIHDFLGGKTRARLRAYTYLYPEAGDKADVYADPAQAARRAADCRDLGFTAVKFDPLDKYGAFDPRQLRLAEISRARLFAREIRAAVGDDCDLLFGSHGQMTAAAAIRLARELEPFLPLWFEEPTPPECPAAAAAVARATSIPIATGERLSTAHDFARVLDCDAAAILQPNLGRVGGIGEAKKIAALAEMRHAQIAPHLYCGPITAAANIQLAAAIPNFLILESIKTMDGFCGEILKTPLRWEKGDIVVPDAPGLGVELNEKVARAHPWRGEGLHLNPRLAPD